MRKFAPVMLILIVTSTALGQPSAQIQPPPDSVTPTSPPPEIPVPDLGPPDLGKPDIKPDLGKPDLGKPDTGKLDNITPGAAKEDSPPPPIIQTANKLPPAEAVPDRLPPPTNAAQTLAGRPVSASLAVPAQAAKPALAQPAPIRAQLVAMKCADEDPCGPPLECCEEWLECWDKVQPRFTLRHDIGDGVGYLHGFSYAEAFVPLYQSCDGALLFADARLVNFDHGSRWEINAGGGIRSYQEAFQVVLGVNGFYDGRHTDTNFFHQLGVGGEAIFPRWEVRCNGYFIMGQDRKLAQDTGPFPNGIINNQLIIDRFLVFDQAMGGLDAEAGVLIPLLPRLAPRAFLGYYHYTADSMGSANGVRGRLEAWLSNRCTLHFSVQHDRVFDTTVNGGLALHFGGTPGRRDGGPRGVEERLGQRVVRDVNIVLTQEAFYERTLLPLPPVPAATTPDATVVASSTPSATTSSTSCSSSDSCHHSCHNHHWHHHHSCSSHHHSCSSQHSCWWKKYHCFKGWNGCDDDDDDD